MTTEAITTVPAQEPGRAIVKGPKARLDNLKTLFERAKPSLAMVLPKHLTADRLFKIVTSAASRTPELLDCTPESVLLAVMQAGALGLEPQTPLGLGYLVPYQNTRTNKREAQFIPGYRGLIRLAIQSGEVQSIQARAIHERDDYEIEYGTDQKIVHKPFLGSEGAGEIVGFYAVAEMRSGSRVFEFMSRAEVDAIRTRSKASASGPWVTDYEEMGKKTAIRRLTKTLPLSEEKLAQAMVHQARAESGDGPDFSDVIDVLPEGEEAGGSNVASIGSAGSRTDKLADKLGANGAKS